MKLQCPLTNLSWDASHWVITASGSREDRTLLKHFRAKVPHPIFSLKKQDLWKLTDDRTWDGYGATDKRLIVTAYLHATGCFVSNIPWMLDAVDVQTQWHRLKPSCEWLQKIYHQNLGIPIPHFHLQHSNDIARICSIWLPAVESCYHDFQDGVSYKYPSQAEEARLIAAQRKMAKQILYTPDRRTIPPHIIKFVLDELLGEKQPDVRKVWLYAMYFTEVKLLPAVTGKQIKIADIEELIEAIEVWDLDNPLRYQVLRIMRQKYQFLIDTFNLVADNENMVSKFAGSKAVSLKQGEYQILRPKDTVPDELAEMLAATPQDDYDNPQVEESTRHRLIEVAPQKEPRAEDYTDRVNYLKQKALWNLRNRAIQIAEQQAKESGNEFDI